MWSTVLDEDFSRIPKSLFSRFDGKSVLVTGATGFVGSLIIKALLFANEHYGISTAPVAVVRNLDKAKKVYGEQIKHIEVVCCNLMHDSISYDGPVDYIVHGAAITTSKTMVEKPVDVIKLSIRGTESVLDFAYTKKARVVYLSSMEAYGNVEADGMTEEGTLGFVNPQAVRSCYPESKRMCETLCTAYHSQYGIEVCAARLAQTFGAGVLPGENRAVVAFSRAASRGEEVILKTKGLSDANYVYGSDAVAAILVLMAHGVPGEVYNVANESCHMTVVQMAQLAVKTVGAPGSRVVFDIDETNSSGFAPDTKLFLDSSKLQSLGWRPLINMPEALRRLVSYLEEAA